MSNTASLSYIIGTFFFTISLGWVVFIYYLIRKKLIDDNKLDKMIDLGKWFMISVAMVLGATIVTDSFKEREQDMKEMEVFDKYVSTITQVEGIQQRWLLCQYFATVSPTGHLKESWENYLNLLEPDHEKYLANQKLIDSLNSKETLTRADTLKLIEAKQETEVMNKSLVSTPAIAAAIDKRIDIDIFYLEGNPSLLDIANQVADQIDNTKYHVRVRKLSKKLNETNAGFHIQENQIHVDSGSESTMATQLNSELGLNYKIIRTMAKATPFYFSIFIVN